MKICVGSGENRFTMSRGSFKYRQKLYGKRLLQLTDTTETEEGYVLSYLDAKKDLRAPFVAMHAPSSNIAGFEKRPLSNKFIVAATLGCILLSTLIASFYMISYIF